VKDRIIIRNARQHNLKGIDLELPRRALIVLTGPSGSGKSSLAFDTIYAEGQRRYVESLSTYAKQFLERMEKPAVDAVEGISPAVAIEQKNPTRTSRSTVGTATEVYDYMRLLWARAGTTHCPVCDRPVEPDTVQSATDDVLTLDEGTRFLVTFPLVRSDQVSHREIVENLRALGFVRVVADGEMRDLDGEDAVEPDAFGVDLAAAPSVLVVVDRLAAGAGIREWVERSWSFEGRASTTSRTSIWSSPGSGSWSSQVCPDRENPRWPSTPSTPRASAATWNRCPRTRGSFSG
jgi:excinuclease ABC subunit A